jgi:photosystem II stability/assembly factor-like uncharacterized protein
MKSIILFIGILFLNSSIYQLQAQWEQLSVPDNDILSILEVGNNLFTGSFNGLYKSTDEGLTWTLLDNGIYTNRKVHDTISKDGYLFAALDGHGVYRSSDDGESWQQMNSGIDTDTATVNVFHVHDGKLFIGTGYVSGLYISNNNGQSWEVSNNGIVGLQLKTEAFASVGSLLFAGVQEVNGLNSATYKSSDGGSNWIPITINTLGEGSPLLGVSPYLIADFSQGLHRSTTFDTSWTLIENGLPSVYTIKDVTADSDYIYVCERVEGVYRSPDYGENWEGMKDGLLSFIYLQTLFRGNNYLYAGSLSDNMWRYPLNPLDVNKNTIEVTEFKLSQNYPNPFNPSTTISFQLAEAEFISLRVYDVLGNVVATLINEEKVAGKYEIHFDAVDLSSGVYFYRLRSNGFVDTKKLIVLK